MRIDEFVGKIRPALRREPPTHKVVGLPAATLAPIFEIGGETCLGLIKRSGALRTHGGQIAFPGGKMQNGESPLSAALRETHEETGMDASIIDTLGYLPVLSAASTEFTVWPVVGVVKREPELKLAPAETEAFYWVPVTAFAQTNMGRRREILAGETEPRPAYIVNGLEIWGLTYMMIRILLHPLKM
jgi:8-oxo-dGTP pyrophosphatase MutT (NUDIX family)